jgi:c-di-GMP-binding flagellar brake protein YcgR
MQLTAQQLGDIVTTIRRSAQKASADERRRFTRISVQGKLQIVTASDGAIPRQYTALSRDISMGGMGFMQAGDCGKGQKMVITLPCGPRKILVLSQVTFSQMLADSLYTIGVQFLQEVNEAYIAGLLKQAQEADRIRQSILS